MFSGTNFWHVTLHSEPWSDQRLSPFFGIGVGKFKNFPNQSLVGATVTDANLAHAIVGVRYHLTERFVLRADWALYTAFVSDQRSTEYRAVTAGCVVLLLSHCNPSRQHEQDLPDLPVRPGPARQWRRVRAVDGAPRQQPGGGARSRAPRR